MFGDKLRHFQLACLECIFECIQHIAVKCHRVQVRPTNTSAFLFDGNKEERLHQRCGVNLRKDGKRTVIRCEWLTTSLWDVLARSSYTSANKACTLSRPDGSFPAEKNCGNLQAAGILPPIALRNCNIWVMRSCWATQPLQTRTKRPLLPVLASGRSFISNPLKRSYHPQGTSRSFQARDLARTK